jgi:hypothetical protein
MTGFASPPRAPGIAGIGGVGGIADVQARIVDIRSRLASRSPGAGSVGLQGQETLTTVELDPGPPIGFEPFGDTYQAALAATGRVGGGSAPSVEPDGGGTSGSFGASSGYSAMGGTSPAGVGTGVGGVGFGSGGLPGVATWVGPGGLGGGGWSYGGGVAAVGGVGPVGGPIDQRFVPTGQPGQSIG